MRKVTAGVVSLVLASGAGAAFGIAPATAAPPVSPGSTIVRTVATSCPTRWRTSAASCAQQALPGRPGRQGQGRRPRTAARSSRSARGSARAAEAASRRSASGKRPRTSTSSSPARRPTRSSWSSPSSATSATRLPRPGHRRRPSPGPATLRRPAAQRDPRAGPHAWTTRTVWQAGLQPAALPGPVLRQRARTRSLKTYYEKQSSGRYSVDGEVTDWVKVTYNEARYGRSDGFPCAGNVCSNTWDLVRDAVNQWVADQKAAGRTDGADQGRPDDVRPVGPLRLRRRRQLQRARRLHRPLPDRARRRRPGRR